MRVKITKECRSSRKTICAKGHWPRCWYIQKRVHFRVLKQKLVTMLLRRGQKHKIENLINNLGIRYYYKLYLYSWFSQRPALFLFGRAIKINRQNCIYLTRKKGKSGTAVTPFYIQSRIPGIKKAIKLYTDLLHKSRWAKTKPFFWQVYKATLEIARNRLKELRSHKLLQKRKYYENKYRMHYRWKRAARYKI